MKNTNVPKGNTISNEVKIDLDVFGSLVLNRVHGHVDRADIVAEDNCSTEQRTTKLLKELAKPTGFSDGVGDSSILGLSTRAGDSVLPLGGPGDDIITEEDGVA
jgi:hypothetical protein